MSVTNRLKLWLLPALGYVAIRLVGLTLRLRILHCQRVEAFWGKGRNVIVAFWHGRQLMMPLAYRGRGLYILISEHRDGELIHRIVRWFGFKTVRGSTTRGGTRALRQLVRLGRTGADLAVTPDGPRGPRCVAQAGVVQLAKLTGLPIVPLTFAASKKNFSGAGTALKLPGRSAGRASCGGSRSGFPLTRTASNWRPNAPRWKRRLTNWVTTRTGWLESLEGRQRSAFSRRLIAESC
jgi:lysophospholipid acyltransferase (LPLAT)-like uncharacterized protein